MKKTISILVSFGIIALSIIILLVFFVFKDINKQKLEPSVNITASDISMNIGEEKFEFYNINNDKAIVKFKIDKEGIINVDKEKIVALKVGVVNVTIIATLNDFVTQTDFCVKVYGNEYSFIINEIKNCEFRDNVLYKQGTSCQFRITLYDKLGQIAENLTPTVTSTSEYVDYQFGNIIVASNIDCVIYFYYSTINYTITLNIINN